MSRPSYDRMVKAIEEAGYRYADAARRLGLSPTAFRNHMGTYRRQGLKFPKSQAIGGGYDVYDPTPEQLDEARAEIRVGLGLPDAEYDHKLGVEEIQPPTQGEWDFAINDDGGDGA